MDITTLNHSKESLTKEIYEMEIEINVLIEQMKDLASTEVWRFDESYISLRGCYHFYYRDNKDLYLTYSKYEDDEKGSIRFGWSSWSFTGMTGEEIQKAQEYIEQVADCLRNIGESVFADSVAIAKKFYAENIESKATAMYEKKRALSEIEKGIEEYKHETEMLSIKGFFDDNLGRTFILHRYFEISKSYSSNVITVTKDKKGYNVRFFSDRTKRTVSDNILKSLYSFINGKAMCTEGVGMIIKYIKFDMITNENGDKINVEEINEEEYYRTHRINRNR